jgi:hypothetical protein
MEKLCSRPRSKHVTSSEGTIRTFAEQLQPCHVVDGSGQA